MSTKFGWCLDNKHLDCRRVVILGGPPPIGSPTAISLTCECECHNRPKS